MKKTAALLLVGLLASCGSKTKNPVPKSEGKALALNDFQLTSFLERPQESRCESIKSFFEDFASKNLEEDTTLEFSNCLILPSSWEISYLYKVLIKNEEKSLKLSVELYDYGNRIQAEVNKVVGFSKSDYDFSSSDPDEGLIDLVPTFKNWAEFDTTEGAQAKIFDEDFFDFANNFLDAGDLSLGGTIKFTVLEKKHIGYNRIEGKIAIDELSENLNFLGCNSIECLNEKPLQFIFQASIIFIGRELSSEGSTTKLAGAHYAFTKTNELNPWRINE